MAISQDLLLAILSLDAYNRGYAPGIEGLGDLGSKIGNATIIKQSDPDEDSAEFAAGFYAVAYQLEDGTRIISYRGTDHGDWNPFGAPDSQSGGSDIYNGWVAGAGLATSQTAMALQFYETVTGHSVWDGPLDDMILTGHSLGGGLAGFVPAPEA
jgi:hypothetical protein